MRIGNWLGGSVIVALTTIHGMAATARTAEHVTTVPLGGSLDGQSGDRYFGVYVPTRFGGVLQIKTTSGNIVDLKRPNGTPLVNGEDIGFDQQGWYTFKVVGAKKPYSVENTFVQVGESKKKPWNFYYWPTKGDSIHEPWAGGNARVDTMNVAPGSDDQLIAAPGGYIPPGVDIILPGPNGMLETLPQTGDDATWFPNIYDDLTWVGPDKNNGGVITRLPDSFPAPEVRPALWNLGPTVGSNLQPEQGYFTLARTLPRWRRRLDPLE